MQTFLPTADFEESAKLLDYRRLGKQRLEAFQLLVVNGYTWAIIERAKRGITKPMTGWRNHPAAIMWRGYEDCLGNYYNYILREWIDRGYRNTMSFLPAYDELALLPPWLGDERLHASHRSNLLRKDPEFYGKYGWTEPSNLPYYWPPA